MRSFMIPENANSMEYGNVLNVIDRSKKESFPDSLSKVPLGFPCGILHCTYEKYPKVLYANEWMFCFWGNNNNFSKCTYLCTMGFTYGITFSPHNPMK